MDKEVTFWTKYETGDGPNPFVPKQGDRVAVCAHEPRPLCIQRIADPLTVNNEVVRWINLCRTCCTDGLQTDMTKLHLTIVNWAAPN